MNNVFLTRSLVGWLERENASSISASGRREAFLSLGAAGSVEETYRIADANLSEFAAARVQTDVAINPSGAGDVPFGDFDVADTINIDGTPHRVLNLSFSEVRGTGRVTYTPVLNQSVILDDQERMFNALRKMVRGTGLGRFISAQPYVPPYQDRLAIFPPVEICETFTKADEIWDGSADLTWNVLEAQNGDLNIVGNQIQTIANGTLNFVIIGAANTADYGITSDDCWVEFDYVSVGEANNGYGEVYIGLRAAPTHQGYDDEGVVFLIQWDKASDTYGFYVYDNVTAAFPIDNGFPGPAWFYPGKPYGRWRFELEGNDARVYLDGVLVASGNDGALSTGETNVSFTITGLSDFVPPTDTAMMILDNICAGDL